MQVPFAELCLLVFCFEMSVGSLLPQSPDEGICFRVGQSNFDQQPLCTCEVPNGSLQYLNRKRRGVYPTTAFGHKGELTSVPRPLDRIIACATPPRADPPDVPDLHEPHQCPVHVGAKRLAQFLAGDAGALPH